MRKLVDVAFVTLDGIMQAPGGPGEDDSGGFSSGGWSVNYWDELMGQDMGQVFAQGPDLLLGRKTYDIFAAYWPNAKEEPGAANLNNARKYVASRTLKKVDWVNSTLLPGDVPTAVAALKAQDGPELQVHGSINLLQTLLKHRLVDELHLWIFPVAIGQGKRLFGETIDPTGFKLLDSKVATTGVIITTYAPDGDLKTGSFA
jgi:dihydrofolate reductase